MARVTRAEVVDIEARRELGIATREDLVKAAWFYLVISAPRRNSKSLAAADISRGLALVEELGVPVPDEVRVGYGYSWVERVRDWARSVLPEP